MREPMAQTFRNPQLWSAVALLALCFPSAVAADELPSFRVGTWEFSRSIEEQGANGQAASLTSTKCTDPAADMRRANRLLAEQGCRVSAPSAAGNIYSFSSLCEVEGASVQSQSVITVESESAYSMQVTSNADGHETKKVTVAKRIGECES